MIIISKVKDKCGKCRAKVTPGYDFCLTCGTKFSEVPPTMKARSSTSEIIPKTKEERQREKRERSRFEWMIAIIFSLCWFGMGGILCLIGHFFNIHFLFMIGLYIEIAGLVIIFIIVYILSEIS